MDGGCHGERLTLPQSVHEVKDATLSVLLAEVGMAVPTSPLSIRSIRGPDSPWGRAHRTYSYSCQCPILPPNHITRW